MTLEIDVTVTGPAGTMTGSATVDVVVPAAEQPAAVLPAGQASPVLEQLRARQRAQAMHWGVDRA